jgi:hypothetical protein
MNSKMSLFCLDCGVNTAKQVVKDPRLLPGAGATEIELVLHSRAFLTSNVGNVCMTSHS